MHLVGAQALSHTNVRMSPHCHANKLVGKAHKSDLYKSALRRVQLQYAPAWVVILLNLASAKALRRADKRLRLCDSLAGTLNCKSYGMSFTVSDSCGKSLKLTGV